MEQTTDGGYILGGYSSSDSSGDKTQNNWSAPWDYWIVKIDSIGVKQWDKRYGGTGADVLHSVHQTSDGGFILGGNSDSGINGDKTQPNCDTTLYTPDYWIVKVDSMGNKQWDKDFGGNDFEEYARLSLTKDKGYLIAGTSDSNISGDKTENNLGAKQTWVVKVDSTGSKQWDKTIFTLGTDSYMCFSFQTRDGCYAIANATNSNVGGYKSQPSRAGSKDYWIIKFCDSTLTTNLTPTLSKGEGVNIFPNPTNDFINISFASEEKNVSVEIFDLLGREVLKRKFQSSNSNFQTKINISDFENGIYIIELKKGNNLYKTKIVKM